MAEIASAFVSIVPSMRGFGGQLRAGVSGSTTQVGKSTGSAFGKVFAAAAALGIGAAVGGYLKGAIEQGSDLAESANKIDAIFGKAGAQVQKFADGGAKALGQTKLEVLNAASQFGTFGKAAGLAGGDLAKFSTDFTSLSTDLASFYNTSPEQAVEAIGAALRGEAEPIRQYGVLLDDATLRQEALKLGLIETTSQALTPQQKVLAAQAVIMKQTSDAQGDFQRTSGGLANQQRILSASLSDLQTTIGTALLPVATQFFTYLNTSALPALTGLGSYLSTNFGPAFDRVREAVAGFFNGSGGDASAWATNIKSIVRDAVTIATKLWDTFGKDIVRYATTAFKNVQQIIGGGLNVIAGIFKTISAIMKGDWSGAWDGIKQIARGAADVVVGIVKQLANIVVTVLSAGWKVLKGIAAAAWDGVVAAVRAGVSESVDLAKSLPGRAAAALSGARTALYQAGRDLVQGLINGIKAMAGSVASAASDVVKGAISSAKNALGIRSPSRVFITLGEFTIAGLVEGFKNRSREAVNIMGLVVNALSNKAKGELEKSRIEFATKLGDVIDHAISVAERRVDRFQSVVDSISSAFKSLKSSVADAFTGDIFSAETGKDFISGLASTYMNVAELKTAFRKLRKFGLSSGFIAQLFANAGPQVILDLAANEADAKTAQTLFGGVNDITNSLGRQVAGAQYGDELRKQTSILEMSERHLRRLEHLDKSLAKALQNAVAAGERKGKGK